MGSSPDQAPSKRDRRFAALIHRHGVAAMDLSRVAFRPEVLALIPADVARTRQVVPISRTDDALIVVAAEPTQRLADELAALLGLRIELLVSDPDDIRVEIDRQYP